MMYAVINGDGTYAGIPCETWGEARELMVQREDRQMFELREIDSKMEMNGP